jgi:hypothetical protein
MRGDTCSTAKSSSLTMMADKYARNQWILIIQERFEQLQLLP